MKSNFGFDFRLNNGFLCLHWSVVNYQKYRILMPWKWFCYVSKDATTTDCVWLFGKAKWLKYESEA